MDREQAAGRRGDAGAPGPRGAGGGAEPMQPLPVRRKLGPGEAASRGGDVGRGEPDRTRVMGQRSANDSETRARECGWTASDQPARPSACGLGHGPDRGDGGREAGGGFGYVQDRGGGGGERNGRTLGGWEGDCGQGPPGRGCGNDGQGWAVGRERHCGRGGVGTACAEHGLQVGGRGPVEGQDRCGRRVEGGQRRAGDEWRSMEQWGQQEEREREKPGPAWNSGVLQDGWDGRLGRMGRPEGLEKTDRHRDVKWDEGAGRSYGERNEPSAWHPRHNQPPPPQQQQQPALRDRSPRRGCGPASEPWAEADAAWQTAGEVRAPRDWAGTAQGGFQQGAGRESRIQGDGGGRWAGRRWRDGDPNDDGLAARTVGASRWEEPDGPRRRPVEALEDRGANRGEMVCPQPREERRTFNQPHQRGPYDTGGNCARLSSSSDAERGPRMPNQWEDADEGRRDVRRKDMNHRGDWHSTMAERQGTGARQGNIGCEVGQRGRDYVNMLLHELAALSEDETVCFGVNIPAQVNLHPFK